MSKNKSHKVSSASNMGRDPMIKSSNAASASAEDDPFKNLRGKIQEQFKQFHQKAGTKKSQGAKAHRTPSNTEKDRRSSQVEGPRGQKRDRNGKVLEKSPQTKARSHPQEDSQDRAFGDESDGDSEDEFEKEVRALGGSAEDLELLAGAESGSELEGSPAEPLRKRASRMDQSDLEKGMANILKEITLAQTRPDLPDDEGNSSDEEDILLDREEIQPQSQDSSVKINGGLSSHKLDRKDKARLYCEPRPDWFHIETPEVDLDRAAKYSLPQESIDHIQFRARSLLDEENQRFKDTQQSSSQSFYSTVMTSGTLSDKISALTLAVQESPLHNVRALETLIGLARKRSRSQAVDVLRALKDLFAQGSLLPGTRRLYPFPAQPLLAATFAPLKKWSPGDRLPPGISERHLIVWAFEDWLKQQYFEVLKILERWCNDEIEFSKSKAVSYVFELLKEKPEQESNLLRLLINKLGDPVKKIASQASYLLMQLLVAHPAMKAIVISAVETDFLFRPRQSLHGKYYAVVTLNQTALSSKEEDLALKLLDIYFGLFTALLKTANPSPAGEETEKRAGPSRHQKKQKKSVPVQPQAEELREKLISAVLTGVNRAVPYAGSNRQDFAEHLDTLFQIAHSSNFNTSVQALMLIQQLSASHQASNDRFYRVLYESLLDPRLMHASKQQLYLNLLHRSLKADLNTKRLKAFVKRLLQVLSLHEPSFIYGAFFLLQDLESTFPSLVTMIDQAEDRDDDEEVFRDVDDDDNGVVLTQPAHSAGDGHVGKGRVYDGHKRAPEHANADTSCAWELLPLLAHFHPSVSLGADHVLRHSKLPGKPDLNLHTLIHFLDRFVYRNPKLSSTGLRGSSMMQPMAATDTHGVLIGRQAYGQRSLPVDREEFRSKKDEDVAPEDVFFHKYFSTLRKETMTKRKPRDESKKVGGEDSDDEDEVWKAMMQSAPDLEGEAGSDDDLDLSDLEEMESDGGAAPGHASDDAVDIEAGIFDESEDDLMTGDDDEIHDHDRGFEGEIFPDGLSSDIAGTKGDRVQTQTAKIHSGEAETKSRRRKSLKALPTFAAASDYAELLEDDADEDV